jgi:hypothetical protein
MSHLTSLNAVATCEHVRPISTPIQLTKWIASHPVTKHLALNSDNELVKRSTANQLYEGEVECVDATPESFCTLLTELGMNDCLSYGIPIIDGVTQVLSQRRFAAQGQPAGVVTRTANCLKWPPAYAILMLDYDPEGITLTPEELLNNIYSVCPALRNTAHIHWVSTSSCLYNDTSGEEIRGVCGQRIYVIVADGSDIPRAGQTLFKRLWLAGFGDIKISSAGSMLLRTIVDGSVWQTNRIDYCAPPICESPLVSRKPSPVLLGDPSMALDTLGALPDLTNDEQLQYEATVMEAKASRQQDADRIRAAYIEQRIGKLVESGVDRSIAEKTIRSAIELSVLHGEFMLLSSTGEMVTVKELLSDPARWHGANFHDPLEPDYHDDKRIARAFVLGVSHPSIYSFAHGGHRYRLALQVETIQVGKGERGQYLTRAVNILAQREFAFLRGHSLVQISDAGSIKLLSDLGALKLLDHSIRFEHLQRGVWEAVDARPEWAKLITGPYSESFKPLKATLSSPVICPESGRILASPGYNAKHQIFLANAENYSEIPNSPSREDITEALRILWLPIRYFPYVAPIDQSVMLCAMLTVVVRKVLGTVPGFGFDAPVQGSGKTLLIKVLCVLAGEPPTMSPPPDSGNDEEMRKRLFACVREGASVIVIDNIVGTFDSPAMASLVTSEHYRDRILGESRTDEVPNSTVVLLSGNNLVLKGDLPRRVFMCRIDPKIELPHQRAFDFDPVQVVAEFRQELVAAALTLMRAFCIRTDTERVGEGRCASFEGWDDLVRQTICWLSLLQQAGEIGDTADYPILVDPMEAINEAVKHDPIRERHGRLLQEIAIHFGAGNARGNMFSTNSLVKRSTPITPFNFAHTSSDGDDAEDALYDLLVEVAGDALNRKINSRSLGNYFAKHRDRVVDGLCLRQGGTRQRVALWYVEDVGGVLGEFGGSVKTHAGDQPSSSNTKAVLMPKRPTKPTKHTEVSRGT